MITKLRILFNWVITIFIGGFLCALFEYYQSSIGFISVYELGFLISGIGATIGLIPLLTQLIIQSRFKIKNTARLPSTLVLILTQLVFAILFAFVIIRLNEQEFYIYFTGIFFITGALVTATNLIKWHVD